MLTLWLDAEYFVPVHYNPLHWVLRNMFIYLLTEQFKASFDFCSFTERLDSVDNRLHNVCPASTNQKECL